MIVTLKTVQLMRAEIDAALEVIRDRHSLEKLKIGKGGYDRINGSFEFKIEGIASGGLDAFAVRYDANRVNLGLPVRGTSFTNGDSVYFLAGLNTTGTKVTAKNAVTGKSYLFKTSQVLRLFNPRPEVTRITLPPAPRQSSRPAGTAIPRGPDEL